METLTYSSRSRPPKRRRVILPGKRRAASRAASIISHLPTAPSTAREAPLRPSGEARSASHLGLDQTRCDTVRSYVSRAPLHGQVPHDLRPLLQAVSRHVAIEADEPDLFPKDLFPKIEDATREFSAPDVGRAVVGSSFLRCARRPLRPIGLRIWLGSGENRRLDRSAEELAHDPLVVMSQPTQC